MISMFSKIKNHALVTGYQNNTNKTTAQPTSTTNTSSTSTSGDQSTSTSATTSSKIGQQKTTATLNSISSNINSLQNACASSSTDSLGKKNSGQQTNIYTRSGVNASSKLGNNSSDAPMNLSGSSKSSILNSSGLSGSLGSVSVGNKYSSAFPVSSFTNTALQIYSTNQQTTKSNASSQLNTSQLKQHRNSSVGLLSTTKQQSNPQTQQKTSQAQTMQNHQLQNAKQQNVSQQQHNIMQSTQNSASTMTLQKSIYQPTQQTNYQQPQQQPQQFNQASNQAQFNQNNYMQNYPQNQNTNPFLNSNYQQQPTYPQQYLNNDQNISNIQQNIQQYNQPQQQYISAMQQFLTPETQQACTNLQTTHITPNVSPHISPKQESGLRSANVDPINMKNLNQQIPKNQHQLILFQQHQNQQQSILQNQQPGVQTSINFTLPQLLHQNKIAQFFSIYDSTGSAGPRLAWRVFSAVRKCDLKPASIFYFEKKSADRIHKPKRKDMVIEVLRREPVALDRFRHPRILNLIHPLEENAESMAFATEPVCGSLANAIGYLDEKQPNAKNLLRNMEITEFEISYGLLQLDFISMKSAPSRDITNPITTQPCVPRLPKICQPDIDFTAPEIQMHNFCNLTSDIYSFVILTCCMFNSGKPIMPSYWKCANYNRQVEMVIERAKQILPIYLGEFRDCALKSLELDHRKRQNSQTFLMLNYFQQPGVQALHYLDVIQFKDVPQKSNFYLKLSDVLQDIPKKLWWQHVLPSIKPDIINFSNEMPSAALQPFITMLQLSDSDEVQEHMLPVLQSLVSGCALRSVQAHITILESLDIISSKLKNVQTSQLLWPMLFNSLDSASPQVQCAALNAVTQVIEQLDPYTIRKNVIPKTKIFFEQNANIMTQSNALICIEKVIDSLNKTEILDEVLPMLINAKSNEPIVLMPLLRIYKQMMCDKRYGLTVNILATKVLPALTPVVVSPNLNLEQFSILVDLLQEMLEHVARNQRNKLKLEKFSMPSTDKSQLHRTQDQPNPGYPHRAPALRLDCRRTSISVDDVNRRPSIGQYQFNNINGSANNSGCNSPDSNLLQVTQQLLVPGRRHSDNTIQPPRILVQDMFGNLANSNGSRASSVINLNILRRHSAAADVQAANSAVYNAAFNPNGIDFLIPNFNARNNTNNLSSNQGTTISGARRYSMVNYGNQYNQNKMNAPSNLFQTLGTGVHGCVQQLFGK